MLLDIEDRWSYTWQNVSSRHRPVVTERSDVSAGGGRTGVGNNSYTVALSGQLLTLLLQNHGEEHEEG